MKITQHLTLRVAWHDSKWNGAICQQPSGNSFCVMLDRVRVERDDAAEDALRGKSWGDLKPEQLPPCKAESGGFMSPLPWRRVFQHPYEENRNCVETHGGMSPRLLEIPEYTAIAVPFCWMLRSEQKAIDAGLPKPLPPDIKPPFPTPWVFGKDRQCALSNHFFEKLDAGKSLAIFIPRKAIRWARVFGDSSWAWAPSQRWASLSNMTATKGRVIRCGTG